MSVSLSFAAARRRTAAIAAMVVLGLMALVVAMSWSSSASADPYPPSQQCSVSSPTTNVAAGTTMTVVGSGFKAAQHVALSLQAGNVALGSVTTNGGGSFTTSVTIPASFSGTSHTIQASAPNDTCSLPLSSHGTDAVSATRGVDAKSTLASTGFAAITASAIGLALLTGGLLFVVVGRRRSV
jgi:hypothetical protein